jgi:uncharacterized membrane protein YedE/YeeE
MIELIQQPWHWAVSGAVIAFVMLALSFFGETFGVSRNFKTMCSAMGAGKNIDYFKVDWKSQIWNIVFLLGGVLGGFIAHEFLTVNDVVDISEETIRDLSKLGFSAPTGIEPAELFSLESAFTTKGFLLLAIGGFLIGFGTRYAEGCTSGHAITGLSNLQLPSLIAVIGFFIGGLTMTFLIFPLIFK